MVLVVVLDHPEQTGLKSPCSAKFKSIKSITWGNQQ